MFNYDKMLAHNHGSLNAVFAISKALALKALLLYRLLHLYFTIKSVLRCQFQEILSDIVEQLRTIY